MFRCTPSIFRYLYDLICKCEPKRVIKRNADILSHSNFREQFVRVKGIVSGLLPSQEDSQFRKRVFDDIKYYWRTLVGEETKYWPKDKLPIQESILRERLSSLENLIDCLNEARENDDDTNLIIKYENLASSSTEGCFKSNLKEIISQTLVEISRGLINRRTSESKQREIYIEKQSSLDPSISRLVRRPLTGTKAELLCSSMATAGIISTVALPAGAKTDSVPITSQSCGNNPSLIFT
jgi:hypothetical protein